MAFVLGTPLTGPVPDKGTFSGKTKTVGLGYNKRTFSLGPAGTSASGARGRKKSLGLQALANTYQGAGIMDAKELVGGNIQKDRGASAEMRNARIAQAKQIVSESAPEPTVSEEPDRVKDASARENKVVGMGGPKIIKAPINRKNPNQREIKPVGGAVRL